MSLALIGSNHDILSRVYVRWLCDEYSDSIQWETMRKILKLCVIAKRLNANNKLNKCQN